MSGIPQKTEASNLVPSSMAPLSPTELLNQGVSANVSIFKYKKSFDWDTVYRSILLLSSYCILMPNIHEMMNKWYLIRMRRMRKCFKVVGIKPFLNEGRLIWKKHPPCFFIRVLKYNIHSITVTQNEAFSYLGKYYTLLYNIKIQHNIT